MKSNIFEKKKTNKRVNKRIVTIAFAIVAMLALLMTGCSAPKSDEERWNDTKNIVSADSLEDNTDYSKFDESKKSLEDDTNTSKDNSAKGSVNGASKDQEDSDNISNKENNDNNGSTENKTSVKTCTISISCATILNNMDNLKEGKEGLVPANGVILGTTTVEFDDGETVFDILARVTRNKGIHMEYVNTPAYNSAYIEGIANLYEKDCGSGSGWMYSVNGWYPDYGCSQYDVNDGDVIRWNYTCDLGADL